MIKFFLRLFETKSPFFYYEEEVEFQFRVESTNSEGAQVIKTKSYIL